MDWSAVGAALAKIGLPLLGAALPIPGGAALGTALSAMLGTDAQKPEDVLAAITSNADAMQKAKEFELTHQEVILKTLVDADIRSIEAVNKSIQTEAASDHWPTYSWRPFIGLSFGAYLNAQWLLPLFHLPAPTVDPQLMLVVGGILGIASFFRGKAQADPSITTDNRG